MIVVAKPYFANTHRLVLTYDILIHQTTNEIYLRPILTMTKHDIELHDKAQQI